MEEGGFLLPLLGGALKFLAPIVLPSLARKAEQVVTGAVERITAPPMAEREEVFEPARRGGGAAVSEAELDEMIDSMSDEELDELAAEEGLVETTRAGLPRGRAAEMAGSLLSRKIGIPSPDTRTQVGIRTIGQTASQIQFPEPTPMTALALFRASEREFGRER